MKQSKTHENARSKRAALTGLLPKVYVVAGLVLLGGAISTEAAQGPQPTICTRACWGARAPVCGISQLGALSRAVIHHTASASDFNTTSQATSAANVRAVQNYHIDSRGWCDTGYHFMVCKLGYIFEGRSGSMSSIPVGAHDSVNANSFGFNWMGYFHPPYNQVPTTAMRNSIYDVIAWRMPSAWSTYGGGTYGGRPGVGNLCTHRDAFASACPGDSAYPFVTSNINGGEARNGVHARRNGGTPPPSSVNEVCDYDGNGRTDFGVYRPASGQWFIPTGTVVCGSGADIPVPGDYNGDGRTDVGVYRAATGEWFINGGVVICGGPGDIPVPGDYNGDNITEVGVYRPSTGQWFISTGVIVCGSGDGDIPVPADYNGDGRTDVAIYRRASGEWFIPGGPVICGGPGDIPVPGDYNGDGRADVGVYRPASGQWFVVTGTVTCGGPGDIPVAGDYNGDGRTDVGVYRPATGQWFIVTGTVVCGSSGDIPLPLPYAIRRIYYP